MPLTAAAVSALPMSARCYRQFLFQHSIRPDRRASLWQPGCFPNIRENGMTSIETAGSQGSGSEISATLVSIGEGFEAVRRGEI
jgi:hypothetical protein